MFKGSITKGGGNYFGTCQRRYLSYERPCSIYQILLYTEKRLAASYTSNGQQGFCGRFSSTFTNDNIIPPWPKSASPSPYEIFGISPSKFDKSKVRILFYKMAKEYHPDSNGNIINDMNHHVRAERFKKLVEAYDILKNDSKRFAYNNKAAAAASTIHQRYPSAHAYPKSYTSSSKEEPFMSDNFYTRGFHEGYEDEASKRMNDEEFQQQLKKNRYKLAALLGIAITLVAGLQLTAIFKLAEKTQEKVEYATWLAEMENIKAKSNYSMGLTNNDRISRFLAVRNSSGYYDNYQKQEEEEVKVDGR